MKRCCRCKKEKSIDLFGNDKAKKDGKSRRCLECDRIKVKAYSRTKIGLLKKIYNNQIRSSVDRGHQRPTYTRKEFEEWLFSQPKFHIMYDNWKRLDFQKEYAPSVDRKDDYIGYTLSNIQLMTWGENMKKGHKDRITGKNNKHSKVVMQYDLDGNFIKQYYSASNASRETGVGRSHICSCCRENNKIRSAGGFIWEYSKESNKLLKDNK